MLKIVFLEVRRASPVPLSQQKAKWSVCVDHDGQLQRTPFIKLTGMRAEVSATDVSFIYCRRLDPVRPKNGMPADYLIIKIDAIHGGLTQPASACLLHVAGYEHVAAVFTISCI